MTTLAGDALEPAAMMGTGAYIAATSGMELGALAAVKFAAPTAPYAPPFTAINARYAASLPHLRVSTVLMAKYFTADYLWQLANQPAIPQRGDLKELADNLEHDTSHLSVIRRSAQHPAFQRLASLGPIAESIALDRLRKDHRPLWLYFLQRTTGERPAEGAASIDEAAERWRSWGKRRGLA